MAEYRPSEFNGVSVISKMGWEQRHMIYELVTLTAGVLDATAIISSAREWVADSADGETLGMWRADIGQPGQVFILRAFPSSEALETERDRALAVDDAFGARSHGARISMETYSGFPFLPPARRGQFGGVFEFRTYVLKPGGLPATLAGWEAAIAPAKAYTDHLVINMFARDGAPRITHIWGFESVEQRFALRREHFSKGLWPPKGGPQNIERASSVIALAEEGWPIG